MNPNETYWMFWKFLLTVAAAVQLMFPSAAAESLSALTCNVTKQPDGFFIYWLSRPVTSSSCKTCWENQTSTVVARDSAFDPLLVQNLTNQFIVLKDCLDYMHFTKNCHGVFEEAHCKVNCSLLLDVDPHQTTTNSTLTCVFGSWCPEQLTIGLGITGILLLAAGVFGGLYIWKLFKRRRGESAAMTTSYTYANQQIKTEGVEIDRRMDIV